MEALLRKIALCTVCQEFLPNEPKPILSMSRESKIIIIGQAPGRKVHESGIPWNDASGEELRRWLNVDRNQFYDTSIFGIMPMGFCYPGKGKSGDLPPRPECAPLWHQLLLEQVDEVKLILLIGNYAHKYYLKDKAYPTLTENVLHYQEFLPMKFLPLVHPSPRNKIWQKKNPWFEEEVVPELRRIVREALRK
ncbi:uracil-DNA glycosylase family protein [Flavobacterium suncheonense]|uniref:IclR family transcriptional regulator n=1 Tax=Flavobacterium suncheonense GH29-5 = DSM 17707 TaxID=1121899 RepID=A0A0A2M8H1_9FLAO|nr:uracil-DNA glycosylase family protein [Flavobacterium suncheonense]KGO88977.1 IclR family transcriptional regulator [Flavobacterium suncheonense GH29-5 = DSM 17707]